MNVKVWKFIGLLSIIIFALSATNAVHAAVVTLAIPPTIKVGSSPEWVTYDSGKGEIFVVNEGDSTVSVISDSTNASVATIAVGQYPVGVAYDSALSEVFVTNAGANTVSVISDVTNSVVATITVGSQPQGLSLIHISEPT